MTFSICDNTFRSGSKSQATSEEINTWINTQLQSDLNAFREILNSTNLSLGKNVVSPSVNQLVSSLNNLTHWFTPQHPESETHSAPTPSPFNPSNKKKLTKEQIQTGQSLLRRYIALVERNLETFYSDPLDQTTLKICINNLKKIIGQVAQIKTKIELPPQHMLPVNFNTSQQGWGEIEVHTPKKEDFLIRKEKNADETISLHSTRTALKEIAKEVETHIILVGNSQLFVDSSDTNFYAPEDLDADHFQPATQLIYRLVEMIEAMKDDPKFNTIVQQQTQGEKFFLGQAKTLVGTKRLYTYYNHAMQNLWFLAKAKNTAKSDVDPLDWLESFDLGRQYLSYFKEKNCILDKSDIFYHVIDERFPSPIFLKMHFTQWVNKEKKYHILKSQEQHHAFQLANADKQDSRGRLRRTYEVETLHTNQIELQAPQPPENRSTSTSTNITATSPKYSPDLHVQELWSQHSQASSDLLDPLQIMANNDLSQQEAYQLLLKKHQNLQEELHKTLSEMNKMESMALDKAQAQLNSPNDYPFELLDKMRAQANPKNSQNSLASNSPPPALPSHDSGNTIRSTTIVGADNSQPTQGSPLGENLTSTSSENNSPEAKRQKFGE